jgi:hypothetical protein
LQLIGWGCGDRIESLPAAMPHAHANRVELRRGPVLEWYENGPFGLQQGFTLDRAPRTCGNDDAVQLVLASSTDSAMSIEGDGKALVAGSFRYGDLAAFDAEGREMPAQMKLREGHVVLAVAAGMGAKYPLTVDPFVQLAKLVAMGGDADALFGHVAVSGNTIVVGEYFTPRQTAYVYVEPAGGWSGLRTETARLIASDNAPRDTYGYAVAISGDTIVVGAARKSVGTQQERGAAYVYVRPVGGWAGTLTEQAKLLASDGAAFHVFGDGTAMEGDTIVIGQIGGTPGALYVFLKPTGGWSGTLNQNAKLVRSDAPAGSVSDGFGHTIGISGDTVVAGAGTLTVGTNLVQGAAYVFVKPSGGWAGTLTERAKLTASDGAACDRFGADVAISADTIVAGALHKTSGVVVERGAAYVFVKPAGGWSGALTQNAKLLPSDFSTRLWFGYSVGVFRDTIVVAAVGDKVLQGSVYEFRMPAGGWTGTLNETAKIVAFDGAAGDQFGESIAFADGTLVVAASYDDVGTNLDQGSAYVFRLCCSCP